MFPSASPPPLTAACWMSSDWNCYVVSITNHWRIRFVLTNWQSFSMQYSFMILFTSKMNFLNFFEWSTKGVTQDSQQIVNKYEQTQGVKNRKAWDEWTSQEITSQKHDAWQITWHWRTAGTLGPGTAMDSNYCLFRKMPPALMLMLEQFLWIVMLWIHSNVEFLQNPQA